MIIHPPAADEKAYKNKINIRLEMYKECSQKKSAYLYMTI
jgi:hypothetical protein